MKKINVFLSLSIVLNVVFLFFGVRYVNGMGGVKFLKSRTEKKLQKSAQNVFSYKQKMSIFNILPHRSNEIIFIGDSNIQYGEWNDLLENNQIRNRGISGDDIEGVASRIKDVTSTKPKKIFIMVGINNLINSHDDIHKIVLDYDKLIKQVRSQSPATKLYVHSLLPTYRQSPGLNNDIQTINTELVKLSKNYSATYINLYDSFKDDKGNLQDKLSFDGIHLNGEGYGIWKDHIQGLVTE